MASTWKNKNCFVSREQLKHRKGPQNRRCRTSAFEQSPDQSSKKFNTLMLNNTVDIANSSCQKLKKEIQIKRLKEKFLVSKNEQDRSQSKEFKNSKQVKIISILNNMKRNSLNNISNPVQNQTVQQNNSHFSHESCTWLIIILIIKYIALVHFY